MNTFESQFPGGWSEELLEMGLSAGGVGLFRWDLVTDELMWSPHGYLMFGFELGGQVSTYQLFRSRVHPNDIEQLEQRVREAKTARTVYEYVYRIVLPNGQTRIIRATGRFYYSAQGAPLCMAGAVIDVTRDEQAVQALRLSEQRFHTLADAMPLLVWTAQPDGYIHWYNQGWYDYTGCTEQDMQGWGWQSVHDPVLLPSVLDRWTTCIAAGEPFEAVFPLRGADGVYRQFLTRARPVKDDHGIVLQWVGSNTLLNDDDSMPAVTLSNTHAPSVRNGGSDAR